MKRIKRMTVLYFVIAAILAVAAYTLAAYTSLSSVKRVVTVKGTEQLFTSDVLAVYDTETNLKTRLIAFGADVEEKMFRVSVSNHLQGDETKYDTAGLSYTLTAELQDSDGNAVSDAAVYSMLKINNEAMNQNPKELTGSFSGDQAYDYTYSFAITDNALLGYRIKLTAVSDNTSYSGLGRIILFTTDKTSSSWTGSFIETEENVITAGNELGIINYQISGQVEETRILSWDSTKVTIDKWFLESIGKTEADITTDGDIKQLELELGAAGTPNRYIIAFYRTYAQKDLEESAEDVQGYITFEEKAAEETTD